MIFDSTEDWVGQPVQTGERILEVADPSKLKLKIELPITERIQLEQGSKGDFFMEGQLASIPVKVTTLGYNAKIMPDKVLAYDMQAEFLE